MSLIHCKECNSEISSEAFDCPKCGAKLRKPTRSLIGNLALIVFICFNVLMLFWFCSYILEIGKLFSSASSEAEKTGTSIGGSLGIFFIFVIWGIGDIVLGLMLLITKPKK